MPYPNPVVAELPPEHEPQVAVHQGSAWYNVTDQAELHMQQSGPSTLKNAGHNLPLLTSEIYGTADVPEWCVDCD